METLDPQKQREFALQVVRRLREQAFVAYWAGGCVRDQVMGRTPLDYDVATNATPDQVVRLFGPGRTLAIGAAFGVIAVKGARKSGQVEVTTFRSDTSYSDGRRPDAVSFSSPEEDAQRRDFTINGLFFDPLENRIIDFVGGEADLQRRLVRAIGDPRERFREDKLRMLRAIRFAATLDFELDEETLAAIVEMAEQIHVVSAERIAQEVRRMLVCPRRATAVRMLRRARLLEQILPEATTLAPFTDDAVGATGAWPATLAVLARLIAPCFPIGLAALLHRVIWPEPPLRRTKDGRPQDSAALAAAAGTEAACRRWRLSNDDTALTAWLVKNANALRTAQDAPWPTVQRLLAHRHAPRLIALSEAIAQVASDSPHSLAFVREVLSQPRDAWDPPPLISGDDLLARGIPQGKRYKEILDAVRDAQLLGQATTRDGALALADRLVAAGG